MIVQDFHNNQWEWSMEESLIRWLRRNFLCCILYAGGTWVGVNNNTDFIKAVTDGTIICEATPIKLGKDHRFGK